MGISITDQGGNTLEINFGNDVSLVDSVSGSDSTLARSELSENAQELLYELSERCSEAVKAEAEKRLDDLLDNEDLDDNEPFEDDE